MLNEKVLSWAKDRASTQANADYSLFGTKYIFGEDIESSNGGLWIYESLKMEKSKNSNTVIVQSRSLPLDGKSLVDIFEDMHYCKLLSPFRAMEWIYIDSLYATQSANQPTLFL